MSETTTTEVVTTEVTEAVAPNATETDEDYSWLTGRLDALTTEVKEAKQVVQITMDAAMLPLREAMEQQKAMNQQLTDMVSTMSQSLTTITSALALSRLTPQNSENISNETVEEVVTENPANVEVEEREARTEATRKRRLL